MAEELELGDLPPVAICSRACAATAPLVGNSPVDESGLSTSHAVAGGDVLGLVPFSILDASRHGFAPGYDLVSGGG